MDHFKVHMDAPLSEKAFFHAAGTLLVRCSPAVISENLSGRFCRASGQAITR
jgi:hypothetical protein